MISINHSQDLVGLADISVHRDLFSSFISKSHQIPKVKIDTPNQKLIQTLLIFLCVAVVSHSAVRTFVLLCFVWHQWESWPHDAGAEIIYHFWHLVAESQWPEALSEETASRHSCCETKAQVKFHTSYRLVDYVTTHAAPRGPAAWVNAVWLSHVACRLGLPRVLCVSCSFGCSLAL